MLEESFLEESSEPDNDDVAKTNAVKKPFAKRLELDDVLEERRLMRELRDYSFDLND